MSFPPLDRASAEFLLRQPVARGGTDDDEVATVAHVEHVDRENIGPLRELLEAHIDDIALLDGDLQKLRQKDDV